MFLKTKYNIKEAIVCTLLMVAAVVILAHAVVSHHHHNGLSCISDVAQHDHEEVEEDCLLSLAFRLHDYDFELLPCLLAISVESFMPQTDNNVCFAFGDETYIPFDYSQFIARSSGLRAPPAC